MAKTEAEMAEEVVTSAVMALVDWKMAPKEIRWLLGREIVFKDEDFDRMMRITEDMLQDREGARFWRGRR